jgi:hypothetical protein
MAPKTVTVRVFCPTNAICVVDQVHVSPGDKVCWDNQTGGDIDILFPDHGLLNVRHIRHGKGTTNPAAQPDIQKIAVDPNKPVVYFYAVYSHTLKKFAYGGSEPEMIVP